MWRAIFFAGGLFVAMWGGTFLMVDEMVLTFKDEPKPEPRTEEFRGLFMSKNKDNKEVFNPPEWVAFTLMSIGSVTMLYSIALPRRSQH
ncbi:hypothetical protein GC176_26645 [bacterium]|nr:hypothetical protein [bacterium]